MRRTVTRLEYEAYDSMAIKEMKKICNIIRDKWKSVKNIAIYHRIGVVDIQKSSIIIAISSPHRKDSLEALNYCIDEVKKTVPIWKKVCKIYLSNKKFHYNLNTIKEFIKHLNFNKNIF